VAMKLEIPIAERIAAIRQQKAQARARQQGYAQQAAQGGQQGAWPGRQPGGGHGGQQGSPGPELRRSAGHDPGGTRVAAGTVFMGTSRGSTGAGNSAIEREKADFPARWGRGNTRMGCFANGEYCAPICCGLTLRLTRCLVIR